MRNINNLSAVRHGKTKIVCTIGPSSWDPEVMRKMIEAGMNCARVNGAFADEAELDKVTKLVRDVSNEVALMMDVKGPEVRMNKFASPKAIKPGDEIIIGNTDKDEIYPANYQDLYKHLKPGQRMVVGDGDTELILRETKGDKMYCEVVFGEVIKPGKALNLPGAEFTTSTLTDRDIVNLKHSLKLGWDFVSASFIQDAKAAREIKKYIKDTNMQLIAKIEDQKGIDNIDEILEEVDGIMIARGGLGVELGLEKIPFIEKYLLEKAIKAGKTVITATQMLESMTYNPRPTRAEVNDVATAVYLGTDCVMLSGESSAGQYPVETVETMAKIALEAEFTRQPVLVEDYPAQNKEEHILSKAVFEMCNNTEVDAVFVVSNDGRLPALIGRHQINQPIYAFVSDDIFVRRLAICKGVTQSFVIKTKFTSRDLAFQKLSKEILDKKLAKQGDRVLIIVSASDIDSIGLFEQVVL